MGRQCYVEKNFRNDALNLISYMNRIIAEYVQQGFRLTVRQLYYQLVARDVIPNTEKDYKRITNIVNDAKMAGLMDWEAIEDRTREFIRRNKWESGAEILDIVARNYHEDMWDNQHVRMFVIVEKEALAGVLEPVCREFSIPLLAARGYPSGTVLREFALSDLLPALGNEQDIHIVHLGDHDPSGIDMSRDLEERLRRFCCFGEDGHDYLWDRTFEFDRVALNMAQILEQRPPKNPAKSTDSRFADYKKKFGSSSWELDALQPAYLSGLVRDAAEMVIDEDRWQLRVDQINEVKNALRTVHTDFKSKGL